MRADSNRHGEEEKSFVEFLEDTVKLRFRDTVTGKKPKK